MPIEFFQSPADFRQWLKAHHAQPPSYQRAATGWVVSANKEDTRQRRLATLIADSASGQKIRSVTYKPRQREPIRPRRRLI